MASFFVIQGSSQGQRFYLKAPVCTLGRDASCDICLGDTEVSRRHVQLQHVVSPQGTEFPKVWTLTDMRSSNGTYINGKRVTATQILQPGDSVQVGSTLMLFMLESSSIFDGMFPSEQESSIQSLSGIYKSESKKSRVEPASDENLEITMSPMDGTKILRTISHAEGQHFIVNSRRTNSKEGSWTAHAEGYLQVLYEMTLAVSHCMEPERLTAELLELIFRWIDADRGCILLYDPITNKLEPKAKKVRRNEARDHRLVISKTILDYVLENKKGVLTSDATQDDRWNSAASILNIGIREVICVPLQGRYGIVGAIYLDTYSPPDIVRNMDQRTHRFGDDHLKLMITIAYHTALAIEDTRYYSGMLQAEKLAAIGQTVATISHHIKNILQGIRGGSYLIEMGLGEHNEQLVSRGWKIVERNQNRISSLVMDMLTLSKERKPELIRGNLNRVVGEVVELMRPHALKADVLLLWTPCKDMPEIAFDPEGIHHAVLNLVTNAVDAATETPNVDISEEDFEWSEGEKTVRREDVSVPGHEENKTLSSEVSQQRSSEGEPCASQDGVLAPRGQVEILTFWEKETSCAKIMVSDTGPGIPQEKISQIFVPFESTKGNRGTGLGLPVCKKIIEEHGGNIQVESREPHGCQFIIILPAKRFS
ncbi:MAG: ATP-binding protein [Planctomycetia bacterium]|nr:ATP-binding protein [Planctomycetia bacterium]